MKKGAIAVAGTVLVDKIYEISAYPNAGELTKILNIQRSVGGCVPNVAIDLKRLSPDTEVLAVGRIGNDGEGKFVLDTLSREGVSVENIVTGEGDGTGFTDVMSVVGGQRTFFTSSGANSVFGTADVDFSKLNVDVFHLGYFLLLDAVDGGEGIELLKRASERGIKTSIDLVSENSSRYASVVSPVLPFTDNLIINETEASGITGIEPSFENLPTIAKKLMEMGVRERVIIHTPKLGLCLDKNGITVLPSYELPCGYIKGTTGAGDAFCAGALIGILRDLSPVEILTVASGAAVASLGKADATSGVVTIGEIERITSTLSRKELS